MDRMHPNFAEMAQKVLTAESDICIIEEKSTRRVFGRAPTSSHHCKLVLLLYALVSGECYWCLTTEVARRKNARDERRGNILCVFV
jgi:hypothetical protein